MRKLLLMIALLVGVVCLCSASMPALAAHNPIAPPRTVYPFPVCGHDLPVLQESNCGDFDFEMGFITLAGNKLTVNGSVGNISNHNVSLPYIVVGVVIFAWPDHHAVLAHGISTATETLLPQWEQPFQTTYTLSSTPHDIGVYWIVPNSGGLYFSWHVTV
jgi:hypothetical protein